MDNLSLFRVGEWLPELVLQISQGGTHGTTELFRLKKAFRVSNPAVIPDIEDIKEVSCWEVCQCL